MSVDGTPSMWPLKPNWRQELEERLNGGDRAFMGPIAEVICEVLMISPRTPAYREMWTEVRAVRERRTDRLEGLAKWQTVFDAIWSSLALQAQPSATDRNLRVRQHAPALREIFADAHRQGALNPVAAATANLLMRLMSGRTITFNTDAQQMVSPYRLSDTQVRDVWHTLCNIIDSVESPSAALSPTLSAYLPEALSASPHPVTASSS